MRLCAASGAFQDVRKKQSAGAATKGYLPTTPSKRDLIMTAGSCLARTALFALSCHVSIPMSAAASDLVPVGSYEVTTETNMPHLEENLRYMTTRATHCLTHFDLATAFPILTHPSLAHCSLSFAERVDEESSYALHCEGNGGTTGYALWRFEPHEIVGTLHVKLGGKNMTFSQRVTARLLGECKNVPSPEGKGPG
jgi:hypothetical protein